ncbi:Uncharacterised protein [Bordetella pertussis]|nr:Uncharacterised protein [Bordetella pertussis]CFW32445.1 Uncharacterised protein [Bordetella pertussis]
MSAQRHPMGQRRGDGLAHGGWVAAVKATGDIGRRDELQHGFVVAHAPGAVAFAHVAIQVDGGIHGVGSWKSRSRPRKASSWPVNWAKAASRAASSRCACASSMRAKRSACPGMACASLG